MSRLLDLIWSFPALMLGVLLGTAINLKGARIGPGDDRVRIEADPDRRDRPRLRALSGSAPARRRSSTPARAPVRQGGTGEGAGPADHAHRVAAAPVVVGAGAASGCCSPNAVVLESALSFLGAGVPPPEPSLGTLIAAGIDKVVLSPHLLLPLRRPGPVGARAQRARRGTAAGSRARSGR